MRFDRLVAVAVVLSGSVIAATGAHAAVPISHRPPSASHLKIDLLTEDLVLAPDRLTGYVSTPAGSSTPNAVIPVDLRTGSLGTPLTLPAAPSQLAISADGKVLYAALDSRGSVVRIDLPAMAPGLEIQLAPHSGIPTYAEEIVVSPVDPEVIVVVRAIRAAISGPVGVTAYRSGTPLANGLSGSVLPEFLVPGDRPDAFFGTTLISGTPTLFRLMLGSDGVSIETSARSRLQNGTRIGFAAGRLFGSNGEVIDLETFQPATQRLDTFATPLAMTTDTQSGRVYFVSAAINGTMLLTTFDATSLQGIDIFQLEDYNGVVASIGVIGSGEVLIRATYGGLAANERGFLYFASTGLLDGSTGEFTSLTPHRILDTRVGLGRPAGAGRVGAGEVVEVQVTGRGGVPAEGVSAVVMNVTAVGPTEDGYLTVFPTGVPRPDISSLNFVRGQVVPNLVTVAVGAGGRVSIYNPFGDLDVLFDVAGFYSERDGPDGTRFTPTTPARILDTRSGIGAPARSVGAGSTVNVTVAARGGVPAVGATAVVLNVTVTNPSTSSYLTVFPGDVAPPVVSNLNFVAGQTVPNLVIVRLPANGIVSIRNEFGTTDVIADVMGYYDDSTDGPGSAVGRFIAAEPFRAFDSRVDDTGAGDRRLWDEELLILGGADHDLLAVVLNVTVTGTEGNGYLTVFPFDQLTNSTLPAASNINYTSGQTVPNAVMVGLGPRVGFWNIGGKAHVIVDVFGHFVT